MARKKRQSRPISRVLSWTVIPLGASSPIRSSSLPGDVAGHDIVSLFGLAPGGVCRAGPLPDSRCALTAPFHPCRPARAVLGGIFLLHFPSARAAQALPGTVPCGARTFLGAPEGTTRLSGRLCRDGLSHGRPGGACRDDDPGTRRNVAGRLVKGLACPLAPCQRTGRARRGPEHQGGSRRLAVPALLSRDKPVRSEATA